MRYRGCSLLRLTFGHSSSDAWVRVTFTGRTAGPRRRRGFLRRRASGSSCRPRSWRPGRKRSARGREWSGKPFRRRSTDTRRRVVVAVTGMPEVAGDALGEALLVDGGEHPHPGREGHEVVPLVLVLPARRKGFRGRVPAVEGSHGAGLVGAVVVEVGVAEQPSYQGQLYSVPNALWMPTNPPPARTY